MTVRGQVGKARRAPFSTANNAAGYPVALAAKAADRSLAAKRKPHKVRYKVVGNRLTCATCGKGIAGARTTFTGAWSGGDHP